MTAATMLVKAYKPDVGLENAEIILFDAPAIIPPNKPPKYDAITVPVISSHMGRFKVFAIYLPATFKIIPTIIAEKTFNILFKTKTSVRPELKMFPKIKL